VPLRKGLRIEDVGRSVAEHAGRNTEWPVPKALVFTPSADLEIGPGVQQIDARFQVTLAKTSKPPILREPLPDACPERANPIRGMRQHRPDEPIGIDPRVVCPEPGHEDREDPEIVPVHPFDRRREQRVFDVWSMCRRGGAEHHADANHGSGQLVALDQDARGCEPAIPHD
jgi:hypothetical protein